MSSKKNRFGKVLAKKRVDLGINMQKMAGDLEISLSFLGSLEVGDKRPIPDLFFGKLLEIYEWSENEKYDLFKAYFVCMGKPPLFLMKDDEQRELFLEHSALMFIGRLSS